MSNNNAHRRPLMSNAGDPQQRRRAEYVERRREKERRAATARVMSTPEGRYVMFDLIRRMGVFSKLWVPSAELHALVGVRDFGLDLMQQLQVSEPEMFQLMEREWWQREQREATATEATQTRSADEGGNDGSEDDDRRTG